MSAKPPAGSSVTSYDVARRAGVSQSAVSRAFRPGASVAPDTRDRIMAAARALGYAPNAIASGLITKRSHLAAIIISNLTNLYYPEVLAELTQRLSARGMRVLLFTLAAESDVDDMLDQVWRYRVDGAIVAARLSDAQLAQFADRGVPVVLYNRIGDAAPVASVCFDSGSGARALVDGLVAAGHRDFAIIGGPADSYVGEERVRAAAARLGHHGFDARLERGTFDHASGALAFRTLAATGLPDAVIAANDVMAIGAIDSARRDFGLAVPGDLSVVGFDGVGPATWHAYQVTTVRQPVRRMTDAAVAMLMERIETPGQTPEQRLFAGEILTGASARLKVTA
ncbi:LacI family DNA-binding transcriptional regulator [Sandaracinobacteroides saxicola]|uniref:LacI family DNA-binding transcriptional regulator n=1 Tax=Sandaracinobacteroides saxicola TaxID=2759707 RepID=A0A7G5IJN2_9SPHN|nr:LacI family DNA-binding transcriptional regulator [Sandaracinobacteroides saxicola]QMW23574.1 LacI family DNA-binding transcriptional regulator [Sandaracinobacteroides saxicola]